MTATEISISALGISIIALLYTIMTFCLKSGTKVRGSYSIASDMACKDMYIRYILLENLKDKSIAIFNIYMQVGYVNFIEIDNFESDPLILKSFETIKITYDPIDLYSSNLSRVCVDEMLRNPSTRKSIVLSTSNGKYVVNKSVKHWDPIFNCFRSHLNCFIKPERSKFQGKAFGGNVKYIVEFFMKTGESDIVPIYPHDYTLIKDSRFQLTKEALASVDSLESFFEDVCDRGSIECTGFKVHHFDQWLKQRYAIYNGFIVKARQSTWFRYFVKGGLSAVISIYRRKKNAKEMMRRFMNTK